MTTIKRNALVPYSSRQMFELVNNIEDIILLNKAQTGQTAPFD